MGAIQVMLSPFFAPFNLLIPPKVVEHAQKWESGSPIIISTNEQWIPWELLYDGQESWGRKFVLARCPRLNDRRNVPDPAFVNGYMIDILLPFAMYLVLGVAKQSLLLGGFARGIFVFAIGAVTETLQYIGVPIFGRAFDLLRSPPKARI
jgi:hypothetical protein